MQVTGCGKIKDTSLYPVLDATSHLMDKVERLYFKERYIKTRRQERAETVIPEGIRYYGQTAKRDHLQSVGERGSQQASAPSQSGDQEEEVGQGRQAYQVCAEERQEGLV